MADPDEQQKNEQHEHDEHTHDDVDDEVARARAARLRNAVLRADPAALREALAQVPESQLREIAKATGTPTPVLRRSADPGLRLQRLTDAKHFAVIAEPLAADCVNATITELGDAADEPSYNQLCGAVDTVAEDHPAWAVSAMLAFVAVTGQPAAESSDRILAEDERFAIPAEPDPEREAPAADTAHALAAFTPRTAPPEVKAARKERHRREQEERRRTEAAARDAARAGRRRAKGGKS